MKMKLPSCDAEVGDVLRTMNGDVHIEFRFNVELTIADLRHIQGWFGASDLTVYSEAPEDESSYLCVALDEPTRVPEWVPNFDEYWCTSPWYGRILTVTRDDE